MSRGLPKSYIKKYGITKKAWTEFRKSKNKTTKTVKSIKKPLKSKGSRRMAKKKKRRRPQFTIPLSIVTPLAWKLYWPVAKALKGDYAGAKNDMLWHFAAIDSSGKFNTRALATWLPMIAGIFIHKFVGGRPLNVNKYLRRVPLIRI